MRLPKMFCCQGLWLIFAVLIKIHSSECTFRCDIFPGVRNLAKQQSSMNAILNCSFHRIIVGAVNWTRNGQPVKEGSILADPHINKMWSAVVLPDMTGNQDVGKFTCAAKSGQDVSSCSASPSKPKLRRLEPVKIEENGRSPEIECRATGWPTPRVSWWRSGSLIRSGDYHNSYLINRLPNNIKSLKIIGIVGYHHGTYTCRAENVFGTSVADITLMVKRTDMIENKFDEQFGSKALEGNNITLECICGLKVCKENTANVYWKSKGHYVNQSARLVLTKTAMANREAILMTILNASKADEGQYFCGINTSKGFEERPRQLHVLKKDKFQISSPSQEVSAKLHSHLMLRCHAIYPSVLTKLETFWRVNNTFIPKESQQYQQKEYKPRNELTSTTSLPFELHISNISVQDVGWYFCGVKFREVSYEVTINISVGLKMKKTEGTKEDAKQGGSKNSPLVAISSITAGGIIMGFVVAFLAYRLCRNKSNTDEPFFETKVNGRQFRYDVFVTFSSQDLNWVTKELIPLMEKHKLKYCIHDRDFEIGKPVVDNMAESVYTSRKVLAVMSHNYMSSKFCRGELEMALYRSTEMGDSSVIVMRIDGVDRGKLPKALRNRTFLDYHDFSERKNWEERLIKHLKPPSIDKYSEKNSGKLYSKLQNTEV